MSETLTDLRAELRAATAADHARLDALVSRLDLTRREDYIAFLQLHAAVLLPLERWLLQNAVVNALPDWPSRSREAALRRDLRHLKTQPAPPRYLSFDNVASSRAGILYVLEGSRLGGRLLLRRVEAAGLGLPTAFLTHGVETKLWASFTFWLAQQPRDDDFVSAAADAARKVFCLYESEALQNA